MTPEVTLGIDTPNLTPSCTVAAGRPTPGTPTSSVGLPIPMFPTPGASSAAESWQLRICADRSQHQETERRNCDAYAAQHPDHNWSGGREFPIRRCLCVECIARLAPKQHLRFRARETFPDPRLVKYSKIAHHSRGEQAPSAWSIKRICPRFAAIPTRRRGVVSAREPAPRYRGANALRSSTAC